MFSQIAMTVKGAVLLFVAVQIFAALLLNKEDAKWVRGAPLIILVGLFVVGMLSPSIWIFFLALVLTTPLFARNRGEAAAIYAVTLIASPALHYNVMLGSFYLMPITKELMCSIGLALAFLTKPKSSAALRNRFDIPILLVLILEIAHTRDPEFTVTLRTLVPVAFAIALPYFLLSRSLNTAEEMRRFLLAFALAGFVMAIVAIVESRLHWLLYKQILVNLHVDSSINPFSRMRGGVVRAPASFPEATSFGIYLAMTGVALLGLRSSFASRRKFLIAFGILAVGLFAPNSRGAFIGIIVGMAAFDLYRRNYVGLMGKIGLGAGGYLMLAAAAQVSPYFNAMIGKGETEGSTDYRWLLWRRGLEEINKHPIFGTALKNALANMEDLRQGEHIIDLVNGYVTYGLVLGYLGMIALLLVFVSLCYAMLAARKKLVANRSVNDLAAVVFAIATFSIGGSFYSGFGGENSLPFYEIAALGASLWALSRTAAARNGAVARSNVGVASPPIWATIAADRAAARARSRKLRGLPPLEKVDA